uniref:Uncharacterized protein n=1 Tax=Arundo donax TaxID=35708 RepID=A0A0A9GLR5_ARUDO
MNLFIFCLHIQRLISLWMWPLIVCMKM